MAHLTAILQSYPPEIGRVSDTDDWPLHVTVMQAFTTAATPEQVSEQVLEILRQSRPLVVTGARTDYFGPNADIQVTVLNTSAELTDLHHRVMTRLSSDPTFQPDVPAYSGDGYHPHVTACNSGSLQMGEVMHLKWAAIVDMQDQPTVIAGAPLDERR